MERIARTEVLVIATQGPGSGDERRIVTLLGEGGTEVHGFDRGHKIRSGLALLRRLVGPERPRIAVIEGTGLGAGLPALLARLVRRTPFVISTGDAVGPFFALRGPVSGLVGAVYERALYRAAAGVIGWTPYLAGRALTLGARRAITAENWAEGSFDADARERLRGAHGIPEQAVVFGIAGSLTWSRRRGYCYGLELVRAARSCSRPDLRVLIVGDGDGRDRLEREAGGDQRVIFTGRVPSAEVPGLLSAMDVVSLPQSRDGVGAFRYTIKLSEYLASGARIVTGRLPFAYDLSDAPITRLAGAMPWNDAYVAALADFMETARAAPDRAPCVLPAFDRDRQQVRVRAFIDDVLEELHSD
ncbi:glycosyltransferase [Paraconexibacter sp.]|uniref:glycosyltransferase n=1 Tax=Paraconexibacter sp. TaxID=2949640 RepID=UPI003565390D